jgi:hypothetical protein
MSNKRYLLWENHLKAKFVSIFLNVEEEDNFEDENGSIL